MSENKIETEKKIGMERNLTPEERNTNIETEKHIANVEMFLTDIESEIHDRGLIHDRSKKQLPEVEVFTKYTPLLAGCTYGSDEYKQYLHEMKKGALDHHYANNRHHPEHFKDGVNDMNLIDIIEMLADWKAASMRHDDGDINKSLDLNEKRFNISFHVMKLLRNTVKDLGWG